MKKKNKILIQFIWGILIAIIFIAGCYLYQLWKQYHAGEESYRQFRASVKSEFTVGTDEDKEHGTTFGDDRWNPVMWIQSNGTPIDYPVMQGTDNSFYLYHLPDGSANGVGSIFMDYQNNQGLLDDNTILYGHHMQNGSMFASIDNYKDQTYFERHPYMTLTTKDKKYKVELFAGYVGKGTEPLTINFGSKEEYAQFLEKAKEKSTFNSDVEVTIQDHILTMVTCDYDFSDARYILFGRLQEQ